jgi:large subunit ribosomal protein L30
MSPIMSPESTAYIRVTQTKSSIGTKPKHRGSLRALGLRGVGRSRVLPDTADVRGMIARVPHLVEVGPASAEEAAAQSSVRDAALRARRDGQGQAAADQAAQRQA